MSMRGAEDSATNTTATSGTPERRAGHHRVHFEALVAVGEAKGSGGFEAESIDVSPEGMRLRTAYLPQIGDKLVCRFEGDAGEVVADGEVIWRREAPRGGEFGLRFVSFDSPDAEATLRSLCQELGGPDEASAGVGAMGIPGTRVRLHIEGLGSPMKARVREATGGEVLVGSNLEFLKVGRSLELEDMDHGDKRAATVDAVKVEVDPSTKVPQLVVSLRFGEAKESKKVAAPAKAPEKETSKETGKESSSLALGALIKRTTPGVGAVGKTEISPSGGEAKEARAEEPSSPPAPSLASGQKKESRSMPPVTRPSASEASAALREEAKAEDEDVSEANDPSLDSPAVGGAKKDFSAALRGATEKAKGATKAAFGAIGPAAAGLGTKAKGAMSGLFASIRKRRGAEAAEPEEARATRRTTAAPPTGALRAAGKRLVRDKEEVETTEATQKPRSSTKAALMGSALGLASVLVLVGAIRLIGAWRSPDAAPQGTEANAAAATAALPAPTVANTAAGDPNAVPSVNVPLFGATPLSTTEPVPAMPTEPDGTVAEAPPEGGAQLAAAGDEGEGEDDAEATETQGDGKQFGKGTVRSPIMLRLKVDGPIETVNGASGAMGFTVSLPGRRALSSATELARKDKRIAAINVVNTAAGAEISLQFKDGVPAYLAKAKGNRLDIALGTDAKKKVAKAGESKKKKKGTLKKKVAAKKKAGDKKKP
ncbi:PilZ domain-containing protein [Polyangium spumosum]|uniref:PilZ domain-containing protein n=1 Tax=Polyangium spumosum TaxID=889282 RepID=A0A6N7PRR6_9BACT|nr:PilZ domain-containing protein [Polyangium spumosum]MRG93516.1 hypothetical protein [Polyangium spumosum]